MCRECKEGEKGKGAFVLSPKVWSFAILPSESPPLDLDPQNIKLLIGAKGKVKENNGWNVFKFVSVLAATDKSGHEF